MLQRVLILGVLALAPIATTQAASPAAAPPTPAPTPPPAAMPHTMHWSFEMGQGRLGAQVSSMTPELRAFFGAPDDAGILVQKVEGGSVAAQAGVAVGDVLVEVDGERVAGVGDVRSALADRKRGDTVDVVVVRKHKRRTLAVRLDDDPMPPLGTSFGKSFGPGIDLDFLRSFGDSPELRDRLLELEQRLEALESGTSPRARPAPAPKTKRKAKPPARARNGA